MTSKKTRPAAGKPLPKIIRDTKRTDFYLDAQKALDYGLIDAIVEGAVSSRGESEDAAPTPPPAGP